MSEQFETAAERAIRAAFPTTDTDATPNPIIMDLWNWAKDHEGYEDVIRALQDCNCAGCSAPPGLIYNNEIAAKFNDWWLYINEALEEYHEETGENFAPETCGHLVWFAVEWNASKLASFLESHDDANEWQLQSEYPSEDEIHRLFDEEILPFVKAEFEQDGQPDIPARSEAFNNWTDSLCKNGEISTWLYENIEHPASCNE